MNAAGREETGQKLRFASVQRFGLELTCKLTCSSSLEVGRGPEVNMAKASLERLSAALAAGHKERPKRKVIAFWSTKRRPEKATRTASLAR